MPVLFSQGHTLFFRTKHFRLGGVFILVEMSAFFGNLFLKASPYYNGPANAIYIYTTFYEMRNYINILVFSESNNISSAADPRNALGNYCAEILNLNSLTNMLQERHSVNLIPKKVKNLLAEKR